jgi:hypothetical protein
MSQFIPVNGYGRTIGEASSRGVDGLFAVVTNQKLSDLSDPQALVAPVSFMENTPKAGENIPNLDSIRTRIRNLLVDSQLLLKGSAFELMPRQSHTIVNGYRPAISTSIYNEYTPPGAPLEVTRKAEEDQADAQPRWMSTVRANMALWPPGQSTQEAEPEQAKAPSSDMKSVASLHWQDLKQLTGPSKIRSSLTRPRSGLKLQDPPSSQAPALHCSSIGSPAPALGNSQPFEEPPFPFAQAPSRPRSTTPGTPEQTQLPSDDEASADEFDMRDYLPPKGVKGSHKYQLDEDDSDSSSKDSGDVDTDPYHGLGKRERHKLIELSPPVARKSSRL